MSNLTQLYESDYHAWYAKTVELLRQGKLDLLDIPHLIEELEGMGVSDKNELESRFMILLSHLLKWKFQPEHRSSSWRGSVIEQRKRIAVRLKKSPGLKVFAPQAFTEAYPEAVDMAAKETGLPLNTFPGVCPFTLAQTLDDRFWPERES